MFGQKTIKNTFFGKFGQAYVDPFQNMFPQKHVLKKQLEF